MTQETMKIKDSQASKFHKNSEIIQLDNVCKTYLMGEVEVPAVRGIDLTINRGDFVAIMGPSGSGKSTALNMVGSLDIPTVGNIYLDKVNIAHLEESELSILRGKKIGFIFQQFNLIPTLTALGNVMMPMIFQGVEKEEREDRAKAILESVDLGHRLNNLPSQLSGGERQRVAIARALANNPEVILADEPTGNLDSKSGENIMQILDELNKQGKTIIMVTHDKSLAEKHAHIIYHLKDGRVIKKETKKKKDKN